MNFDYYCIAFIRDLPRSFPNGLVLHPPPIPIDMEKARLQHDSYTELMRSLVDLIVEIPADESCPDCVFIEVPTKQFCF